MRVRSYTKRLVSAAAELVLLLVLLKVPNSHSLVSAYRDDVVLNVGVSHAQNLVGVGASKRFIGVVRLVYKTNAAFKSATDNQQAILRNVD
jgi:hypothetical protein